MKRSVTAMLALLTLLGTGIVTTNPAIAADAVSMIQQVGSVPSPDAAQLMPGLDDATIPEGTVLFYSPNAPEGQQWYQGEKILNSATKAAEPAQPDNGPVLRLNPWTIGACNAGFGDTEVASFASRFDGKVLLRCGSDSRGYVHIRSRHEQDWKNQMGGPGNWDDYMVWASDNALRAPAVAVTQPGNKRCYSTPIAVYRQVNGQRQNWNTFQARVIVSINNKIVITAFPTSSSWC